MPNERTLPIRTISKILINDILIELFGNSLEHDVYQGLTAEQ